MTMTLKKILMSLAMATLLLVPSLAFSGMASAQNNNAAAADPVNLQGNLCGGVNDLSITSTGGDCTANDDAETSVNTIVTYVINIFSIIVGIIAVIMIIVGGLKYITSGGDSNKVTSAKNSIVYAIIGLIIVALAQIIVKFVLSKATQS